MQTKRKQYVASGGYFIGRTQPIIAQAFFSGKRKIGSLYDVLMLLGSDLIVKSVIQVVLKGFFGQYGQGYALCKGGLYLHSVGAAVISEKLAETAVNITRAFTYYLPCRIFNEQVSYGLPKRAD